jgi:hypothetical protein
MTGNDSNFGDLKDHTNHTWSSGGGGIDHDCFKDPLLHCFPDSRLANSFVKLRPSGPNGLELVGSFSPRNSSQLSAGDSDLGSSAPILLPGDRLVGGGKQGRVYVIDAATMLSLQDADHTKPDDDGFEGFQAFKNTYHADRGQNSCTSALNHNDPENYCRQLFPRNLLNPTDCAVTAGCYLPTSCYQHCQTYGPNIHAGFVYWQPDLEWGLIYASPERDHVKAFRYDVLTRKIEERPFAISQPFTGSDFTVHDGIAPDGMPGGALSISANGNQNGILWVSIPSRTDATWGVHRGSLVALDARDLHHLWDDQCISYFAKFNPPTVVDGRVYLATFADPVEHSKDARPPGEENCKLDDPSVLSDFTKTFAGFAWIIEYGLK